MADRFFCSELSKTVATLSGAEAHHALHVLRLKPGDAIDVFDGHGTTGNGIVESVSRNEVVVTIHKSGFTERPQEGRISIAACLPKGDRLKWLIEKLTELGVDTFIPLKSQRAVVDPGKLKRDKLLATVISASKQCGRNWLLNIAEPADFHTLATDAASSHRLYIAHPYQLDSDSGFPANATATSHLILVGPEGGFTDDEVDIAAQCGAISVEWPGSILRIETAAIMAAIVIRERISADKHNNDGC